MHAGREPGCSLILAQFLTRQVRGEHMRRAAFGVFAVLVAIVAAPAALGSNYIVLYKQQAVPAGSTAAIQKAGGSVVATYPQIGVVVASSGSASFRGDLLKDASVANASSINGFAIRLPAT